ncbi:MAG TPA: type II toxin-antitoxin system Phd/YefM family antitoxin [Spirochaetota bacterium]|nr:type II toxin-antitoxin system Phd/YefM family antitoxin [Spirochaetota bacterium]HOR44074.1 type II toxin-antitoxin system Phd/YefM family antitoxin [Spirochaetota bacterium]HOU84484.1 type II toxin-antitoxin system Phd/YefM family antitoxin [Spirochaetota bacterium]HPK56204.1 type II toxin-antitoxin system Phd/YefM family antitoxin [Spirochaetota bacterium]HQE58647.1 type II toxin-antitoxin system Phd/YefM family antitoxin [Spirochaetota bacterium]
MKTINVANLKADFSSVIDVLKNGDEVVIEYGKRHEKLAVIVPYKKYKRNSRKIGILKGKASFKMNAGYKMSAEDLLNI